MMSNLSASYASRLVWLSVGFLSSSPLLSKCNARSFNGHNPCYVNFNICFKSRTCCTHSSNCLLICMFERSRSNLCICMSLNVFELIIKSVIPVSLFQRLFVISIYRETRFFSKLVLFAWQPLHKCVLPPRMRS